jgi:hypothetical protein
VKHKIWTSTFTAVVGVATATVLGAQAPTTTQQQPTPAAPAASAEKTITVVGCLRAAPSSSADAAASTTAGTTGTAGTTTTAGTTGTAGTATAGTTAPTPAAPAADSAQQKFVLTDAGLSAADAGTTSTAGAAAAPTTTTAGSAQKETYRLVANGSALSPHVGKKLELTGTLEANGASATDSTSGPDAGRPMLRVQSGRVVAASCDAK